MTVINLRCVEPSSRSGHAASSWTVTCLGTCTTSHLAVVLLIRQHSAFPVVRLAFATCKIPLRVTAQLEHTHDMIAGARCDNEYWRAPKRRKFFAKLSPTQVMLLLTHIVSTDEYIRMALVNQLGYAENLRRCR